MSLKDKSSLYRNGEKVNFYLAGGPREITYPFVFFLHFPQYNNTGGRIKMLVRNA